MNKQLWNTPSKKMYKIKAKAQDEFQNKACWNIYYYKKMYFLIQNYLLRFRFFINKIQFIYNNIKTKNLLDII